MPVRLFDLLEVLSRRSCAKPKLSKRVSKHSVDECLPEAIDRNTFGHWGTDTTLGRQTNG